MEKKKAIVAIYAIIGIAMILIFAVIIGANMESDDGKIEDKQESKSIVLVDDDNVKVTFEKVWEEESLDVFYLNLKVTNKTNDDIWVHLDRASVNDTMMPLVGTGVPLRIKPEKSGVSAFIFPFSPLSEVEEIEFDIVVEDVERIENVKICL